MPFGGCLLFIHVGPGNCGYGGSWCNASTMDFVHQIPPPLLEREKEREGETDRDRDRETERDRQTDGEGGGGSGTDRVTE